MSDRCEKCGAELRTETDEHFAFIKFRNGGGEGPERLWCSVKCLPRNLKPRPKGATK